MAAAAGPPAWIADFPPNRSVCCTAIRHPRQSPGNHVHCRPNDARHPAGIARHPTACSSRPRRSTASFSSDRAPVVGNWGCVHVGIVTGKHARIDRWQHHGVASRISQHTDATEGVPGDGKGILRPGGGGSKGALATHTCLPYRATCSPAGNVTGEGEAEVDGLPARPTAHKFPAFNWGPFTIYHGGPRAAYRVSDAPGSRTTKFFKTWADVCQDMVRS